MTLSLGPDPRLDPAKIMRLVQSKGSRWRLTPDMQLSYAFTEQERETRMKVARARLSEIAAAQ